MPYKQAPFIPDIPGAIVVPAHEHNVRPGDNHPKVNVFHTPEEKADAIEVTPFYFAQDLLLADPPRRASVHNYISGGQGTLGDGDLYQMVPERYGAIANGVTANRSYPADTDPSFSLNLQSRSLELEGYAATIHLTMPRGCKQWNKTVLWVVEGFQLHEIPLNRAHNIGHYQVSNVRTDPGRLDIDAILEDALVLLETEEDMPDRELRRYMTAQGIFLHAQSDIGQFRRIADQTLREKLTFLLGGSGRQKPPRNYDQAIYVFTYAAGLCAQRSQATESAKEVMRYLATGAEAPSI